MSLDNDTYTLAEGEKFDASVMKVNTDHETLFSNVRSSIRLQLPQISPHQTSKVPVCIVGGGWSLNEPSVYDELRELYFNGAKIVALNGSAKWLMERNLKPSLHVILDARPQNVDFLNVKIPNCKTMLASQCDPVMFDAADDRDTYIFHAVAETAGEEISILDEFYGKGRWVRVPAAGTVGITSILLLRILGFRFQHMFGIDSCYKPDGTHHAYPQSLNDNEGAALFKVAGREYLCSAWQAAQARNFLDVIRVNGEHFEIDVHGDGLLSYLLKTGAEMPEQEK